MNNPSEAVMAMVRYHKPSTYWSKHYKRADVMFIVDVRVEEGREDEPCLVVCGTALNERQVRAILPIPSFLMLYTALYILHGEIKCLSVDFRVLESTIMNHSPSVASFWTYDGGLVMIDWPKILPEVYILPPSFKTLEFPFIKGTTLEANFPLNGASLCVAQLESL